MDMLTDGPVLMAFGLIILILHYALQRRDFQQRGESTDLERALPGLLRNTKRFMRFVLVGVSILGLCVVVDVIFKRPYKEDTAIFILSVVYALIVLREHSFLRAWANYYAQRRAPNGERHIS
jgi:ABC-type uncharacterized transport system permease subunit